MSQRYGTLRDAEYFHVYNRSVEKKDLVLDKDDAYYFLNILSTMNTQRTQRDQSIPDERLVTIYGFSILNNHFHFVLKAKVEDGIQKYIHKISSNYGRYFNKKYSQKGYVFTDRFSFTPIQSKTRLLEFISYTNCNHLRHEAAPLIPSLSGDYVLQTNQIVVRGFDSTSIIALFGSLRHYKQISRGVTYEKKMSTH